MGPTHLDSIPPQRLEQVSTSWALASGFTVALHLSSTMMPTPDGGRVWPRFAHLGQGCCPQPPGSAGPLQLCRGDLNPVCSSFPCGATWPGQETRWCHYCIKAAHCLSYLLSGHHPNTYHLAWCIQLTQYIILWGKSSCSKLSICTLRVLNTQSISIQC